MTVGAIRTGEATRTGGTISTGDATRTGGAIRSEDTSESGQASPGVLAKRRSPVPPPVAPKPRRQNPDAKSSTVPNEMDPLPPSLEAELCVLPSPSHIYSMNDIDNVEDILPPPPEFAFPPTPEHSTFRSPDETVPSDEALSSVSNSTLVPDQDYTTEARLVLDTESTDRDTSSTSSSPLSHNKHSWSVIHQSKVKERAGQRPDDTLSPLSSSVESVTAEKCAESAGIGLPKWNRSMHKYDDVRPTSGKDSLSSVRRASSNLASSVPRKQKISLEIAITEGSILPLSPPFSQDSRTSDKTSSQGSPLSPGSRTRKVIFKSSSPLSPTRRQGISQSPSVTDKGPDERSLALRRVPNRPAPPPPTPSPLSKVSGSLSPDETRVLQMVFPQDGKPAMMRPVVHDTQKRIEEMLSEIESGEENEARKTNTSSYGE